MNVSAVAGSFLTAVVLTAACGCPVSRSGPASTAATSAVAAVSAASAAGTTSALSAPQNAGPQHCLSSALRIKTAAGSGEAMDGAYWDLTFTNTGLVTCTLAGYPGVSFLTASRTSITAPATRACAIPRQVTLAPGQTASAQLKTPNIGNLPKAACHQATAASLEVYPPNDIAPVFVPTRIGVCAGRSPGGSVWTVVPGSHAGV